MEKNTLYIKTDENKIINTNCIIWVQKMGDCLEVCTRSTGCSVILGNTHMICKSKNQDGYNKLNNLIE